MSKLVVKPDGNGWKVSKNGRTVSNHRLKNRAVQSARSKAKSGGTVEIRRSNGTIQSSGGVR